MRRRRGVRLRDKALVRYGDVIYERDLQLVRRAAFDRAVAGDYESHAGLATRAGCHRSTVSAFLRGDKQVSMETALAILVELHLTFDQTHRFVRPADPTDRERQR
jgi:hypothetical protein